MIAEQNAASRRERVGPNVVKCPKDPHSVLDRQREDASLQPKREGVWVARGVFGAHMHVALVNDRSVTIVLDG